MIKVLSIGNSFSQDAQRYLHGIARADGINIRTVNLCIGGCSFDMHFRNMLSKRDVYSLEMNGEDTGFYMSLEQALLSQEWDYITLQQASHFSNNYGTYQPYLNEIASYIRKMCPKAKILIHETWAYEQDSGRLKNMGYTNAEDMLQDIQQAYGSAKTDIGADGIIASGSLFGAILASGISRIHRDTFHASFGLGRYALGLLWYKTITGNSVMNNTFSDFDEVIAEEDIEIVKKCVERESKSNSL